MMKKYIVCATLIWSSVYAFGQNVDKLIKEKKVKKIIATLSADDMQGRGTFTPGIEKAAQFIAQQFKKAGLKPLAGNNNFRQTFYVTRRTPVSTQASINGAAITADRLIVSSDTSFSWKNAADAEVFHITADQDFTKEYRKYLTSGKKQLVFVDDKFADVFKRLQGRFTHGSTSAKPTGTTQVAFVLGNTDQVQSIDLTYVAKSERFPLTNIAGMIPGKTKPDEYIVFSGHYDHLGILKPMEGDSIANGADDDASGTTAVITLAKYYRKLNNARTLIFVAFTAEETGGFGSQYFSKQLNPDKTMAMFNIEMIGKASKFGENSAFITGYERSDFGKILQNNLAGTKFTFYPDPYKEQNLFYRSDNATLARLGVPAHTISTDQIDIDKYYHTVKDELSTLDVANITATIKAIALSSKTIVNGTDTPTRIPPATVN